MTSAVFGGTMLMERDAGIRACWLQIISWLLEKMIVIKVQVILEVKI